jgi:DNA-binding NarL/FixJ family response regulator
MLSEDQRRVLSLAARGLVSSEIAERLGWPQPDVQDQLRLAIHALGARSKLEAVIIARRRGSIELPR